MNNEIEIRDLDKKACTEESREYMKKNGYDTGKHKDFTVGDLIFFNTGYDDDIRAKATIKGIDGDNLYVYTDSYWFPIQDNDIRKIERA